MNTSATKRVSLAYTVDTEWRNRTQVLSSREEGKKSPGRKWAKEFYDKLVKE